MSKKRCGMSAWRLFSPISHFVAKEIVAMPKTAPFQMRRLGVIMRGDLDNPDEVLGVLNPATARAPDGKLYLFPRVVAASNYSRVGIAEVVFDANGDPTGVERRGYALSPAEPY